MSEPLKAAVALRLLRRSEPFRRVCSSYGLALRVLTACSRQPTRTDCLRPRKGPTGCLHQLCRRRSAPIASGQNLPGALDFGSPRTDRIVPGTVKLCESPGRAGGFPNDYDLQSTALADTGGAAWFPVAPQCLIRVGTTVKSDDAGLCRNLGREEMV